MNHLTLYKLDDWICFRSRNTTFVNHMKRSVIPSSYRKYDADSMSWLVYWEKAPVLVEVASKYYKVDWSKLPEEWQTLITDGEVKPKRREAKKSSPYAKLYLLDNAPKVLVKVVYKALLLEYHPDHNDGVGDQGKLNEVIEAYREIISTFDS